MVSGRPWWAAFFLIAAGLHQLQPSHNSRKSTRGPAQAPIPSCVKQKNYFFFAAFFFVAFFAAFFLAAIVLSPEEECVSRPIPRWIGGSCESVTTPASRAIRSIPDQKSDSLGQAGEVEISNLNRRHHHCSAGFCPCNPL